ncbi:ATP-binding protein [Teredinibacter sp. KSP-S5-2]|uniref:ATP-binding protein n=1 Tax=Teredinibacter sp. KSP-S5-2 TaxID=3034506 RepID=UPI00293449E9|nr:ATP-binding protein [Teredinibacter sp. KSP-S5-2]WNO11471.1 ATP-binding protein [Teredinibacter sp. KSP-S5-2]
MEQEKVTKGRFVVFFTLIITTLLALIFYAANQAEKQIKAEISALLDNEISVKSRRLSNTIQDSIRHVDFLHATPPIEGIVRAKDNNNIDTLENTPYNIWVKRLEAIFSAYMKTNANIAQLRVIGKENNGRELVRVQRKDTQIIKVSNNDLQEKGHRDYFTASQNLSPGQIYISSINLNREFGKIDEPPWPTYRVTKPIFDNKGEFFGIVIVNFDAKILLKNLRESRDKKIITFLVNENGNYLIHPDKNKEFAWEYSEQNTWLQDVNNTNDINQETGKKSNLTNVLHIGIDKNISVLTREIRIENSVQHPQYRFYIGIKQRNISTLLLKRLFFELTVTLCMGAVILMLLYLYLRLSQKTNEEIRLKAKLEAIFEGTQNPIVTLNRSGAIASWNSAAERQFNLTEEHRYRLQLDELIREEKEKKLYQQAFKSALKDKYCSNLELRLTNSKRNISDYNLSLSPIQAQADLIKGVSVVFHDISQSKKLQKALETTNQRLVESNMEMEKFIYSVSHDLKAPLITIGGFTEKVLLSLKDNLDEKNTHRLERVLVNTDNMSNMLNDLLNLSRILQQTPEMEKCKVIECIEPAIESLEQVIDKMHAEIILKHCETEILCNKTLLTRGLQNLIDNAIKYAKPFPPPKIHIRVELEQDTAKISVCDNGIGIPIEHQQKVFDIFEHYGEQDGNGVGLAIVKSIAEKHNGRVTVQSSPGEGSCFTLHIPRENGHRNEAIE